MKLTAHQPLNFTPVQCPVAFSIALQCIFLFWKYSTLFVNQGNDAYNQGNHAKALFTCVCSTTLALIGKSRIAIAIEIAPGAGN